MIPGSVVTPTLDLGRGLRSPAVHTEGSNQAWKNKMNFENIGEIIATRRLQFLDESDIKRTVSVFVGKPQQSTDSNYYCPFQVIGIGSQKTQAAQGQDSIQALQSALILIAARLNHLNVELGGTLSWDGANKGDLGFPL